MWKKIITGLHNLNRKPLSMMSKKSIKGVWNNIVMAKSEFELMGAVPDNLFSVVVGTGENTNLWNESWLGTSPLSLRFPNLFKLEKRKSTRIYERRNSYGFAADWKRTPRPWLRSLNLKNLKRLLTHFPS